MGPSGCGKTTLLRLIAGFVPPDAGRIMVAGGMCERVAGVAAAVRRVFQSYALFPHMTVAENVGYGLRGARGGARCAGRPGAGDAGPGGVAAGKRAVSVTAFRGAAAAGGVGAGDGDRAADPAADEPLSALDKNLREEMQVELRVLQQRVGITTVFVTHDQEEALTLADRVAVMRGGRVAQVDTPRRVYDAPADEFVATFLGTTNLVPARVVGEGLVEVAGVVMGVRPGGLGRAGGGAAGERAAERGWGGGCRGMWETCCFKATG